MTGSGITVEGIEVGSVGTLFHEEHLGSQAHDLEELVLGQFFPGLDLNHAVQMNPPPPLAFCMGVALPA